MKEAGKGEGQENFKKEDKKESRKREGKNNEEVFTCGLWQPFGATSGTMVNNNNNTDLEKMSDVVQNGPGLNVVAVGGDLHVVHAVEEQGQRLEEHQGRHDPMNPRTEGQLREAAKKSFFVDSPLREGGVRGCPLRKEN